MYSYDRQAAIRPVGPLGRTDENRYSPLLLWARDLLEDAQKLDAATRQGKPEDSRLLKSIEDGIKGYAESLGWKARVER